MREFGRRLEDRKANLETWREHKKQIVTARVQELLQEREPFPWGR
jgi:hypothetical protein